MRRAGSARWVAAVPGIWMALLLGAAPASAETFTVNDDGDAGTGGCTKFVGECTLREAIVASNGDSEADLIMFNFTGSIDLQGTLETITMPVTIRGPGQHNLTIHPQTGSSFPILISAPATASTVVRIEGVRVADGTNGIVAQGSGQTEIDKVWIEGNVATGVPGGGILAQMDGGVSLSNSTVSGNQAAGGAGIFVTGDAGAGVINSTITGNSTAGAGGGILIDSNALFSISSSAVVGNTADSNDSGGEPGGGIVNNSTNPIPLFGVFRVANTILADNKVGTAVPAPSQCSGGFADYGHNLLTSMDAGCTGFSDPSDRFTSTPLIGPLTEGLGPTPVIPLLSGSPAIDAGYPFEPIVPPVISPCPGADQRGLPRGGLNGPCDIGAFEVQNPAPPAATPPPAAAKKRKCKKGRKLVRRKGKLRCKKKKKKRG